MGLGQFKAREQNAELAASAEGPVIKPHFAPERFQAQDEEMKARGASNFLTAHQKAIYCSALEEMGYARGAELAAGTSWRTVKEHREMFPDFDAACVEAMEGFRNRLHSAAFERAVEGWDEPVFYQGRIVGSIRRRSDRLMELMLRAHIPEKFRDNVSVDATVRGGVLVVPAQMSMEEWMAQHGADAQLSQQPTIPPDTVNQLPEPAANQPTGEEDER